MPTTTFLYHTEAVGASGHISVPVVDTMPLQASVASAISAGSAKVRVENFRHLDYLRVGLIESHVVSSFSQKDEAHGTMASVLIEDLSSLNVVTCGRLMTRLTSKHDDNGNGEASFILHGTHFDNLRIAGQLLELNLAVGLFSELSTWTKLNDAYNGDVGIRAEIDSLAFYKSEDGKLPVRNGIFGCTLALIPENLPRGLSRKKHGIYVPHFGTVYAAEYYITPTSRRLRMLHVDLGCSVEGCHGFGDTGANGAGYPGSA
jgi:hypothetical protein